MSKDNLLLGFIQISGRDVMKFLQGQLTCDINEIQNNIVKLGAHCNPQGRIISFFRIFFYDENYFLQMPRATLPIAITALKKYSVFFKVSITELIDDTLIKGQPENDIYMGIPNIYPETSEKFLPHELNLQNLDAISFTKGCFTGQEIIARMHYRGKVKTQVYRALLVATTPPIRGSDIFQKDQVMGTLIDYSQIEYNKYELLVLLPISLTPDSLFVNEDALTLLGN